MPRIPRFTAGNGDKFNDINTRRSRFWCITWNNPPPDHRQQLQHYVDTGSMTYAVAGNEVAPTTGTPHLQMFVVMEKQQRLHWVRKLFLGAVWCKEMYSRSTPDQAIAYCKKEGNWYEVGELPTAVRIAAAAAEAASASRSQSRGGSVASVSEGTDRGDDEPAATEPEIDPTLREGNSLLDAAAETMTQKREREKWTKITDLAKNGDFKRLRIEFPAVLIRNYAALQSFHRDTAAKPEPLDFFSGIWIKGKVNMGKTYLAEQFAKVEECYYKSQTHWWDHYNGEPYVILDEMSIENARKMTAHLKVWTGKLPFTAEKKGGSQIIRPLGIIVTCNWSINEIWLDQIDREAIHKRFIELEMAYPGCYDVPELKSMLVDRVVPAMRPKVDVDVRGLPQHMKDLEARLLAEATASDNNDDDVQVLERQDAVVFHEV